MNLKEIKTIFKELRLERRKIQTQEKKMKKFYMVIKHKEKEFNDEKLQIQQKKDCKIYIFINLFYLKILNSIN